MPPQLYNNYKKIVLIRTCNASIKEECMHEIASLKKECMHEIADYLFKISHENTCKSYIQCSISLAPYHGTLSH